MEGSMARKASAAALAAALLLGGGCLSAAAVAADAQPAHAAQQAGWVQDGGRWWYAHEGSGYATGWERIGGE